MAVTTTDERGGWWSRLSPAVHRYRDLFRDRTAAPLLLAAIGSAIGDWLNFVAIVVLASNLGIQELAVGGALAIRFIPRLMFQGPAGTLVDRRPGRGLLALSQIAMAVIAAGFLLLEVVPSLWLLFTLIFLLETAYTIARPAFAVQVLRVVQPDYRSGANAVLGFGLTAAQFIGGWLGGLLMGAFGNSPLFVINSVSFLVLAAVVLTVRPPSEAMREMESGGGDRADQTVPVSTPVAAPMVDATVADANGYVGLLRLADVRPYLVQQLCVVALIQAAVALFVDRSRELGQDASGAGTLISMVGLGLLIGSAIGGVGRYVTPSALVVVAVTELVSGIGLVIFGWMNIWPLALLILIVVGIGSAASEVAGSTFYQHRLPQAVYGRFYSLYLLAFWIGGLTGSLVGPLLHLGQGVGTTLLLMAIPTVVSSLWLWQHGRRLMHARVS